MYHFSSADLEGIVEVTYRGRVVACLEYDGETLHDFEGFVEEKAILEVLSNLEGWLNNGGWTTSV